MKNRAYPFEVALHRLESSDQAVPLPRYATDQAAGLDVRANFPKEQRAQGASLAPMGRILIPTGFSLAIPKGYEAQLRPRSGLALKHGITLLNSPGTIDSDYRGEIGIILINHGQDHFTISHGARIAQMVFAPILQARLIQADHLDDTQRGASGFGSTGTQ